MPKSSISVAIAFTLLTQTCGNLFAQDVKDWSKKNLTSLVENYVHLHKNPELSFMEKETADYVARELREAGCDVTQNVGGFGVVGILENGSGPVVLVRTDLDGLPVTEQNDLPYASKKVMTDSDGKSVGTMHACGHDIHMTCLIGAARFMGQNKSAWAGKVIFIGQPAEERGSGARAMLDDKLFDRFGRPDFALALHCSATLPTGTVSLRSGYAMANVDSVDIEIKGRGGHGAYPHTTIDPIVIAAKLILDLQTIVSREIEPTNPSVITVGSIHAGTKHNIISDSCHLQVTVRSYTDEVRKQLLDGIKRKAAAAAESAGAEPPEVVISEGTFALANDDALATRMRSVFESKLGKDNVKNAELQMGGEDFSLFGRAGIPSLMFQLGTIEPRKLEMWKSQHVPPPSLHSALYAPEPQRAIDTGVCSMIWAILELMPSQKK